ncbi:hypothetical protein D3C86_1495850 [compost metagenome]
MGNDRTAGIDVYCARQRLGGGINAVGVAVKRFNAIAGVIDTDIATGRVDPDAARTKTAGGDIASVIHQNIAALGTDDDAVGPSGVQPAEHGDVAIAGNGGITCAALDDIDGS